MANKDAIEVEGIVAEALPNTQFRVEVSPGAPDEYKGRIILCTLSGKMRQFRIKVMPGDKVKVEVTKYDLNRGRISFRMRE